MVPTALGKAQLGAQDFRGDNDCHDIDRGTGVEERRRCSQSSSAFVNTAEERQDGAGTYGKQRAGDRCHATAMGFDACGPRNRKTDPWVMYNAIAPA